MNSGTLEPDICATCMRNVQCIRCRVVVDGSAST